MTPPAAILRNNLAALATRGVTLPASGGTGAEVRLDEGPQGPALSIRSAAGAWLRLHSARDPIGEADRWLDPLFESGEPDLVIIVGLGFGYVLDAIERRSARTRVLAVEPVPASLEPFLGRRDWRGWIDTGRLTLLAGPEYHGASRAWMLVDLAKPDPPVLLHPVVGRAAPQAASDAQVIASRAIRGARANAEARRQFAGGYLTHTLANLAAIAREADAAALFGAFRGVPAVVVSAGPSLDRNIDDLRAIANQALLIAVDTALRPLLAAGVHPHLVVGVDPHEINGRHLDRLPPCPNTWLVAEGSLAPVAFRNFAGRTFSFRVSRHEPWPWLDSLGFERGQLRAWGSVSTSAFDLALQCGADPIVFAGLDLSYTGGMLYCRGTTFEEDWTDADGQGPAAPDWCARLLAGRPTVTALDLNGREVTTASHLVQFRDWLREAAAAASDRRIVNATGAGILHGSGVEQARLHEVLPPVERADPARIPRALQQAWHRGCRPGKWASVVDFTRGLLVQEPAAAAVYAAWQEFAAGTLTVGQVLGALALAVHDHRDAAAGEASLMTDPDRALLGGIARSLVDAREFAAAATLLSRLIDGATPEVEHLYLLGFCFHVGGLDPSRARALYDRALALGGPAFWPLVHRAALLRDCGEVDAAREDLRALDRMDRPIAAGQAILDELRRSLAQPGDADRMS